MREALYDQIGRTYSLTRRPDPRIAAAILRGLGDAKAVVNVGAGAGAYEPTDRAVLAAEPSWRMIQQRQAGAARVVQAAAEALPFPDGTFDASLAVLTLHHWTDWRRGLDEMRRVANRLVVFTIVTNQAVHELRHKRHAVGLHAAVRDILRPRGLYLVSDHFFGEGGLSNDELYMTVTEQRDALLKAGFSEVTQLTISGSLVLHRAT